MTLFDEVTAVKDELACSKRKVEGKKVTPDPIKKAKSDKNGQQVTIDDCIPRMLVKQGDLENGFI